MHFTILGASGFIGLHLLRTLKQRGYDCFIPKRDNPAIFTEPLGHVFYCIGLTADYQNRPFDTIEAHVCYLNKVLEKSQFEHFLYLSSTRLYDSSTKFEAEEGDDLILNPHNPRHLFDFSKSLGESICLTAGQGRTQVVRLSSVYGDDLNADGFLPFLLRQSMQTQSLQVDTHLDTARDYIHLDEVVDLILKIVTQKKQGIYNVASGVNVSNRDIFKAVAEITGCHIHASNQGKPDIPPKVSIKKIKDLFGFKPSSILENIQICLEKHRFDQVERYEP